MLVLLRLCQDLLRTRWRPPRAKAGAVPPAQQQGQPWLQQDIRERSVNAKPHPAPLPRRREAHGHKPPPHERDPNPRGSSHRHQGCHCCCAILQEIWTINLPMWLAPFTCKCFVCKARDYRSALGPQWPVLSLVGHSKSALPPPVPGGHRALLIWLLLLQLTGDSPRGFGVFASTACQRITHKEEENKIPCMFTKFFQENVKIIFSPSFILLQGSTLAALVKQILMICLNVIVKSLTTFYNGSILIIFFFLLIWP